VAGFGNLLRGDDGFGVRVVERLQREAPLPGVELLDVGTGGLRMAQELMGRYDRLIVVDAMDRGAAPGTVFVLKVEDVVGADRVDAHLTVPASALAVARALDVLPADVYMVGCQPDAASVEELTTTLSAGAQAAVETAITRIRSLVQPNESSPPPDAGREVAHRDQILEVLYWMEGEGFAGSATLPGIARFLDFAEADADAALRILVERGDVVRSGHDVVEFRLTEVGRREAARRFAEEFAPMLKQGHGECSDPDCDCQTSPEGAAACQARAHQHSH
jgi:hydrogenase maturation protease